MDRIIDGATCECRTWLPNGPNLICPDCHAPVEFRAVVSASRLEQVYSDLAFYLRRAEAAAAARDELLAILRGLPPDVTRPYLPLLKEIADEIPGPARNPSRKPAPIP